LKIGQLQCKKEKIGNRGPGKKSITGLITGRFNLFPIHHKGAPKEGSWEVEKLGSWEKELS
jgi:hypothetical protein